MALSTFDKAKMLHGMDVFMGPRDPSRNTLHQGSWMVCVDVTVSDTKDASYGGFCIVGDDLNTLIDEAFDYFVDETNLK